MNKSKIFLTSLLCAFAGACIGAGGFMFKYKDDLKFAENNSLLAEVQNIISENKVEMAEPEKADESLLNGYLEAFDQYTKYIPEIEQTKEERELAYVNESPCFESCGIQVGLDQNAQLYFSSVNKGSPADVQGIKQGDIIVQIDGNDITESPVDHTRELLGKDGTKHSLVLIRGEERVELDFVLKNPPKKSDEVECKMLDNEILYTHVKSFGLTAGWHFNQNAGEMIKTARAVIIDVRDNGGGATQSAMDIANMFITEGKITLNYYNGNTKEVTALDGEGTEDEYSLPVVILCNEETASAAEIFTSLMMHNYEKTTVVGVKTFGKGIFQSDATLSNGGTVFYTAGYYTVDDYECYHGIGLEPDITVEMDKVLIGTNDDIQLKKAIEILSE